MLRRQKFELSGGPEQRRQHTGMHRWRGREFVHFADRTGGKLTTFIVNLIATVSYAKDPCPAVALKLQVSSVISLQRFQTTGLSPGAGVVRKRTVAGESLHIRHLPDCSTAGRERIIVPHVPRALDNDAWRIGNLARLWNESRGTNTGSKSACNRTVDVQPYRGFPQSNLRFLCVLQIAHYISGGKKKIIPEAKKSIILSKKRQRAIL